MNNQFKALLDKYSMKASRLTIKNNVRIVNTDKGIFVIKKNKASDILNTYRYLKSRAFDYFPDIVGSDEEYDIYEYVEDVNEPNEQKILDMVYLLSILHSKTTFYKEVTEDDYKKMYEEIRERIEYLYNYYNDVIEIIELNVYMSPSEYLLARNISKIYECLNYSKKCLETWYKIVKDKKKMRVVKIHNNLNLDHYIKTDKPLFISWNKSKIDIPIYDLYNIYKNHYLEFEFSEILAQYESKYPLLEEERILLITLLVLPDKINSNESEYKKCSEVRKIIDYLYKTEKLVTGFYKLKVQ